jgi:hypothetical protein
MNRLTLCFLLLFFVIQAPTCMAGIDLSYQFPAEGKMQKANTCYLHAGISLLEAALARNDVRVVLDDALVAISYSNRLLHDTEFNEEWRTAQKAGIAKNLYFYSRGKLLSPLDYGMFNKELLQFLVETPVYESSDDISARVEEFWKNTNEQWIDSSQKLMHSPSQVHPAEMAPDEILNWGPMAVEMNRFSKSIDSIIQRLRRWRREFGIPRVGLRPLNLPVPEEFQSNEIQVAFSRLKDPSSDQKGIETARAACDSISKGFQQHLRWYLENQIPVGLGVYPAGMEFSPSLQNDGYRKVFRTNPHALVLIGTQTVNNEAGKAEEYFIFRDSGYFERSRFARMPIREACRILTATAIITDKDVDRIPTLPPPIGDSQPEMIRTSKDIRRLLSKESLSCDAAMDCPKGIAKLISIKEAVDSFEPNVRYADRCTSFLVGQDILATNSHCLPSEIRHAGADCSGKIFAIYPDKGAFSCKKVLHAEQVPFDSISMRSDFALLLMEKSPSDAEIFAVSKQGFTDGQVVEHYSISNTGASGFVRKQTCETAQNTYLLPTFTHRFFPRVTLAGCEVQPGHSGSPLIDPDNGAVVGIVDSSTITREFADTVQQYSERGLLLEPLRPLAIAGNFACIQPPHKNTQFPDHCRPSTRREITNAQRQSLYSSPQINHVSSELQRSIERWKSGQALEGNWDSMILKSHSDFDRDYVPIPNCVPPDQQEINLDLPVWRYAVGFDRNYRFQARLSFRHYLRANLSVSRRDNTAVLIYRERDNSIQSLIQTEVPVCESKMF